VADRDVDFLLVGGGVAAASCALALREAGADGSILIAGREIDPPYHRPPLSKGYLRGNEDRGAVAYAAPERYAEQQIEVLTRTSAMALDLDARTVKLSSREEVGFGQALLATGAGVRRLNVEGSELDGIHYLRALANADAIRADAAGKRVVLIGGSYIACEVAATLTELGASCSLLMLEELPLSRGFGLTAGRFFSDRLAERGVRLHGGQELDHFEGADGRVTHVVAKSGLRLEADAVVMGTGALPDVKLARAAGLELGASGGVQVNGQLESSAPGVFAAGDIAEYRSVVHDGRAMRVEHWDVAINQGRSAARNMLGLGEQYTVVPYFFSDLSDWASLEYVGPAADWDAEVVRGEIDHGAFSVWYLREGRVAAMLSVERGEELDHARRLISSGRALGRPEVLGDLSTDLAAL
jgi:3-phenylpropionate/trans-cinnamate dioxygenase ferredoxin reductase subunit